MACAIYGVTVFGLFAISATYHRHKWGSERTARLMKRADHSMIFLFIAGSYTPFSYLALPSRRDGGCWGSFGAVPWRAWH